MSALKRVERWLTAGGFDDHARGLYEGGMFALDVRALLALAKQAVELKRRIRLAREVFNQPHMLLATGLKGKGTWSEQTLHDLLDLRKPLPKGRGR